MQTLIQKQVRVTHTHHTFSQRGVQGSSGHPIAHFGQPNIHTCTMQWDEKELDTHFAPNMYFWTPNSEILAKALIHTGTCTLSMGTFRSHIYYVDCNRHYKLHHALRHSSCTARASPPPSHPLPGRRMRKRPFMPVGDTTHARRGVCDVRTMQSAQWTCHHIKSLKATRV